MHRKPKGYGSPRMLKCCTILIGAAIVMACDAAHSQTRTIAQYGGWKAFSGSTDAGRQTCGVDTFDTRTERHFLIQYTGDSDFVSIRAVKSSWRIPEGTEIHLRLTIDSRQPWVVRAYGSGRTVQWRLNANRVAEFSQEFRAGLTMRLQFQSGSEPDWIFSLRGTNAVFDAFAACLSRMLNGVETQPFGARPSQPYPQGGTQPFAGPPRRQRQPENDAIPLPHDLD